MDDTFKNFITPRTKGKSVHLMAKKIKEETITHNCIFWNRMFKNPDINYCELYIELNPNAYSCEEMLKFSTHTPLFLDKVIINFNENDIRSILIHLVNELNKSNFNQNVNNIYFNCECLFELLHRISLIKHFNLINDFKRFFVEFYNIKNEIKCCIFDIDLDSIKYMKSDSLVIKKALFLIYYVMKFNFKFNMQDACDFKLNDLKYMKNLDFSSVLRNRNEIMDIKENKTQGENESNCFDCSMEKFFEKVYKIIKVFVVNLDKNAVKNENMIYLIMLKFIYNSIKVTSTELRNSLIKLFFKIMSNNLSSLNCSEFSKISQKNNFFLKPFYVAIKIIYLTFALNSHFYYENFFSEDQNKDKLISENNFEYDFFNKLIKAFISISKYLGDDSKEYSNNLLLFFKHRNDKIRKLKKEIYCFNKKLVNLFLDLFFYLTTKNSLNFGSNNLTNNKLYLYQMFLSEDPLLNKEKIINTFEFDNERKTFNFTQLDPKGFNKYFFSEYFIYLSKYKQTHPFKGLISSLLSENLELDSEIIFEKNDSILFFCFSNLMSISKNLNTLSHKEEIEFLVNTYFDYIKFFIYDDYLNCYYLLSEYFLQIFEFLFDYFQNEILDIILYCLSYLSWNNNKRYFKIIESQIDLVHLQKFLKILIKKVKNFQNNRKEFLIKILNIIIHLMRISFFIGKSFSSENFLKILFKIYPLAFNKNFTLLCNKNIEEIIETDNIKSIYSVIVEDYDYTQKNFNICKTNYFKYSIHIHYLIALNECIESFDGIMRIDEIYEVVEEQLFSLLNLIKNHREDSCFSIVKDSEKIEFLRLFIKLFTNVFFCPPILFTNVVNYFNYLKTGKFQLENVCFVDFSENLNNNFIKKIKEDDKERIIENFLFIILIYLNDFKEKYLSLFLENREFSAEEKFIIFNFYFEDVCTINLFLIGLLNLWEKIPQKIVKQHNSNLFKFMFEYIKILLCFSEECYFSKLFLDNFTYFHINSSMIKELKVILHSFEEITNIFEITEIKNNINSFLVLLCPLFKEKFYLQEGFNKFNKKDKKFSTYQKLVKIFIKKLKKSKEEVEEKVDEDNDDSDPPEHIKIFFSEIEKHGDSSKNIMNLLNIIVNYYGDNLTLKEILRNKYKIECDIQDLNNFIENSANQMGKQLEIPFNEFVILSSNNMNLSKVILILSNIVKYNAYKALYQKMFKSHLDSLSAFYDNASALKFNNDVKFYVMNLNVFFFSSILTNSIIFFHNFSKPLVNSAIGADKIINGLKIIQYSGEFQNQLFKNLTYKTILLTNIQQNFNVRIRLNDILIINLYTLSKIYLLYNEFVIYETEFSYKRKVKSSDDYDIVNTLCLMKNNTYILKLYKSNFDTLIEIIQGTQHHIIDDFVIENLSHEENNNFVKNYNKDLFMMFLNSLNDLLVKVKYKSFTLAELISTDFKVLQQYIFVFLNSILEQNFQNKIIISIIISIFPANDILKLLHSNTIDFINYYNEMLDHSEESYTKDNLYNILREIETGNFISNVLKHLMSQSKEKLNEIQERIEERIDFAIQSKTQTEFKDGTYKQMCIQYFRVLKMIFLYVKIISKLYNKQDNQLINYDENEDKSENNSILEKDDILSITKFVESNKKKRKIKVTKKLISLINWYYDKSYVQIEIHYNKFSSTEDISRILVFYPVPEDCLLISYSTKAKILDRVDRSSSISKLSSFLNNCNMEILLMEMEYFRKIQNGEFFNFYKFFNDLSMWPFELFNFFLSVIINLVILSFMDNTKLETGDEQYNWIVDILSFTQMIYCFIYIVLWLINRFYISLVIDLKYFDYKIEKSTSKLKRYLGRLKIILFENLLFHNEFFTFFLVLMIGIITKFSRKLCFLYGFQLIAVLNLTKTLKSILFAIISKAKQFILAIVLEMVIVYIFSFIGFTFLNDEFFDNETIIENGVEKENIFFFCTDFLTCYLFNLHYGIRDGGGIGSLLSKKSFKNENHKFMSRFYFDMLYWFSVILIMLNIVMGIVIDTFGELREKMTQEEDDKKEKCMICGKRTEYFEKFKQDFQNHIRYEHHVWEYLFFIIYISKKESSIRNSYENLVYQYFHEENYSWLPNEEIS